jgi:hypothetical protein
MVEIKDLQNAIDVLEKTAIIIEGGVIELITGAPKSSEQHKGANNKYFSTYEWKELPKELEPSQQNLTRNYISWYNSSYPLINKFVPEKENEFVGVYGGILKHIQLRGTPYSTESMIADFTKNFEIQRSILLSIPSVIKVKSLLNT